MVNKQLLVSAITEFTVSYRKDQLSMGLKCCFVHVTVWQILSVAGPQTRALNPDLKSQETLSGSNNPEDRALGGGGGSRVRRRLFQGRR